jgi:hypothetical protein
VSAVPDVPACQAYLGQAGTSWTAAQFEDAFNAEKRAQARKCRVPAATATTWPDDLAEALYRRVHRNLAMRNLPLAVQQVEGGGIRIGANDGEIRRLEAPFLKVRLG